MLHLLRQLRKCLCHLLGCDSSTSNATPSIRFSSITIDHTTTVKGNIMAAILRDDQQVDLTVAFVDRFGNAASVDGVPVWSEANSLMTLTPSADGLSCTCVPNGTLGDTQVSVSADADMGAGVVPLVGTLDVTVVAGQAVGLTVTFGTPTDVPAAP